MSTPNAVFRQANLEAAQLGHAERIVQAMLRYADHLHHGRPGIVRTESSAPIGATWAPVYHRRENDRDVVYAPGGRPTAIGFRVNGRVVDDAGRDVGRYQPAGLFPEAAAWMYRQAVDVWQLNNEFAARWASYAFRESHRDMKVVLAALMLVQNRRGDVIRDAGGVALFSDADYREVGESMLLTLERDHDLSPKLVLRIRDVLRLPEVVAINREQGFGSSPTQAFLGRWPVAVRTWLRYREENPQLLEGLLRSGYRKTLQALARYSGYRPVTAAFFRKLRWKQTQAKDGHRSLALNEAYKSETWDGCSEAEICVEIQRTRPSWLNLVGRIPPDVGLTRAIVVAAIEAGSVSKRDYVNLTPTLEALGLLSVPEVMRPWQAALKTAEDMRAANVAKNVRTETAKSALVKAADEALQRAVEETVRGLRVYFLVDVSGSMATSIDRAKEYLTKLVQAFPLEQLHVAVFNTVGTEVRIPHRSAEGVAHAFRGHTASGGTSHAAGVRALTKYPPSKDEDALFIFVGDEEEYAHFASAFGDMRPAAFGLVRLGDSTQRCVQNTASALGIPCFLIDERTFADPYAIPRTLRALIAATPVQRKSEVPSRAQLVDTIARTELLRLPLWAVRRRKDEP